MVLRPLACAMAGAGGAGFRFESVVRVMLSSALGGMRANASSIIWAAFLLWLAAGPASEPLSPELDGFHVAKPKMACLSVPTLYERKPGEVNHRLLTRAVPFERAFVM